MIKSQVAGSTLSNGGRRRWSNVRRLCVTLLLCAGVQLLAPAPAHAWFAWLDRLSGPGPFWGTEFDVRVACLMAQSSPQEALGHIQVASSLIQSISSLDPDTKKKFSDRMTAANREIQQIILDSGQRRTGTQTAFRIDGLREELARARTPVDNPVERARLSAVPAIPPADSAIYDRINHALIRARDSLRALGVPRVALFPAWGLWGTCTDRSHREVDAKDNDVLRIVPGDRRPLFSFLVSYRDYRNSELSAKNVLTLHWTEPSNSLYAGGKLIHFQVVEPKLSVPLSGRYDFLDAQAGVGVYRFSSSGMTPNSRWGVFLEPVRADVHFPARWADAENLSKRTPVRWAERFLLSFSYRVAVAMFPSGFPEDAFDLGPGASEEMKRAIPGNEAILQQGIVLNVGRIFGW